MRSKLLPICAAALLTGASAAAVADDGAKVLKRMNGGNTDNQLTVLPEDVGEHVSEAEHAFTDMMKFYVPMQAASGATDDSLVADEKADPREYYDIEGNLVETLPVARPLINVFIYGPAVGVEDTPFAHSFMDTFAAVSLDDGMTWKTTNLSQSADQSSFNLEEDHVPSGGGHEHPLPDDHDIPLRKYGETAWHAPGYETPYTSGCTKCHGATLEGGRHAQSCFNCHEEAQWERDPILVGPVVDQAEWDAKKAKRGKLEVEGGNIAWRTTVTIVNGVTGDPIGTRKARKDGDFKLNARLAADAVPCTVAAEADGLTSSPVAVEDAPETCIGPPELGPDLTDYPGGVYNVFHATAGNKTLVAWPSRFCQQGKPAYSFAYDADPLEDPEDELVVKRNTLAEYLGIDLTQDLYLTDLFGVAGQQGSIDFADEEYPQAGVVPFGCVWTTRGVLLPGDDPRTEELEESHMVWTNPERLTSGRRDPNRIEVKAVAGAGFVMTWQEDPDGLRPGQGEGPGEGWSGAVAHDKTDIWYSFIPWEHFDTVESETVDENGDVVATEPVNIADHNLDPATDGSGRPKVYVPMAVPMRLTNNDKCGPEYYVDENGDGGVTDPEDKKYFSYCNHLVAEGYGLQNFCADTVAVPQGKDGVLGDICVNEDGLPNLANTGSTRPRLSLQGYDSDGDEAIDSAWVVVAAEESKGLGRYGFDYVADPELGLPCTPDEGHDDDGESNPDCGADIGKNQWYFSFDMGDPTTSATADQQYGLARNLVQQGNLLNQPEVNWRTGDFYPEINTSRMWDFVSDGGVDYNFDLYNTEIARRASLLVQSIGKATGSRNGLLATPSWKQGAMRQGGPADTMLRRILLPDAYGGDGTDVPVPTGIETNPYAFVNMDCTHPNGTEGDGWILTDGSNPYYPDGLCLAPATNLSGSVPDTCIDSETNALIDCPKVDFSDSAYGIGDTNPILQGYVQGEGNKMKVLTWHQCPSDGTPQTLEELGDDVLLLDCETDDREDEFVTLKDQSWYNPLEVSKGHRGFIDGDFVMFLYAWSPTWRLNAKGNDRYDLYVRRSFDGGQTWTTTPAEEDKLASDGLPFGGDGTVTCQTYRSTVTQTQQAPEPHVCFDYPAGGNEQARNVTQHQRMQVTTLDPRYAPTPGSIVGGETGSACIDSLDLPESVDASAWSCDDTSVAYDSDERNPSRYFMVFETGDNSTVAVGEAEPDDLFYSRAESFGDDYVVWFETDTAYELIGEGCYPSDDHDEDDTNDTVVQGSGFCNEFDRMNAGGDTHSSEANLEANPDGSKLYGVWTQWVFDESGEEVAESDAMARRIWWIDDYICDNSTAEEPCSWTLPGTNQSGTPDPQQ